MSQLREVLEALRGGKSSLTAHEEQKVFPLLKEVDALLEGMLEEARVLVLVQELTVLAKDIEKAYFSEQDADVSTRMTNIAGWEIAKLVGLVCAHHVFLNSKRKEIPSNGCVEMCLDAVNFLLAHQEARCRGCAATVVACLAKSSVSNSIQPCADTTGTSNAVLIYEKLYDIIYHHTKEHLVNREADTRPVRLTGMGTQGPTQEELELDDLSGWHNLETSYAAYRSLIEGYGGRYIHLIQNSPKAYDTFIDKAGMHINRYVRQAACELIGVIGQCSLSVPSTSLTGLDIIESLSPISRLSESSLTEPRSGLFPVDMFTRVVARGMEDSWCQVRLASTQATGVLLRCVKHFWPENAPSNVENFIPLWSKLVPRLCLNRHYTTDSVRSAAHHSWRHIPLNCLPSDLGGSSGGAGVLAIPLVTQAVVDYYCDMTKHKNHMVVEAACAAIAELGSRVEAAAVRHYLPRMCLCLRSSLADTSWPIRDTAATAVGRFLRFNGIQLAPSYFLKEKENCSSDIVSTDVCGDESMHAVVGDLLGLLFTCLREDPFRPVRESAAVGLVDICLQDEVELGCDVWWNIEKYVEDNMLFLCQSSRSDVHENIVGESVSDITTSVDKSMKKVQFIPNKMLASLMANKSASDELPSKGKASKEGDQQSSRRWLYSNWQESPGDSASSRKMKRKKRKEMLAQRVSAGWGCCLDCGAGDNGEVTPCEVSWSCLLLLKELKETLVTSSINQNDVDVDVKQDLEATPLTIINKATAVQYLLWKKFKYIWNLLSPVNYRDSAKFHSFLYEQILSYLNCWFPAKAVPPPIPYFTQKVESTPGNGGGLSSNTTAPRESSALEISGKKRLALHEKVRVLICDARSLWIRDFKSMSHRAALQLRDLAPDLIKTDVQLTEGEDLKTMSDIHSPQKDAALDACLRQMCSVFGDRFVKDILAEN